VNAIKPKPKATGLVKFQGFVMHANIAQVTVRAKDDERAIPEFSALAKRLRENAANRR